MESVYLLWHSHPLGDDDVDEKLVGVYASEDEARSAQNRLAGKPGFSIYPQAFEIAKYQLGEDHWTEGYITV